MTGQKIFKSLDVICDKTDCNNVILFRDRVDDESGTDCIDGITIIAWHKFNEMESIQKEFIPYPEHLISRFIIDYSSTTAQDFADSFNP